MYAIIAMYYIVLVKTYTLNSYSTLTSTCQTTTSQTSCPHRTTDQLSAWPTGQLTLHNSRGYLAITVLANYFSLVSKY